MWHGAAGLGVGLASTFATAPFAGGGSGHDGHVAAALLICSPLLSMVVCLFSSSPRWATRTAVAVTIVLAPVAGVVNAVATYVLSQWFEGLDPVRDLGLVIVFAVPFGGIPGLAYSLPLAFGTWAARRLVDLPPGTRGAAGKLVAVIAVTAALATLFSLATSEPYGAWLVLRIACGLAAALCLLLALRDLRLGARLRRIASSDRFEVKTIEPGAPVDGVTTIAPYLAGRRPDTVVLGLTEQDQGPYRVSSAARPVLVLAGGPAAVRRSLRRGAALFLALALALGCLAVQVQSLTPRPAPPIPYVHG